MDTSPHPSNAPFFTSSKGLSLPLGVGTGENLIFSENAAKRKLAGGPTDEIPGVCILCDSTRTRLAPERLGAGGSEGYDLLDYAGLSPKWGTCRWLAASRIARSPLRS